MGKHVKSLKQPIFTLLNDDSKVNNDPHNKTGKRCL